MIDKIEIKNFKSIVDLKIDLGRVNIIIGANGCGKTNILEAISFASAASQDKLDNEFLFNRGIRVTPAEFMYSAFEDIENEKPGRSAPLREPSPPGNYFLSLKTSCKRATFSFSASNNFS